VGRRHDVSVRREWRILGKRGKEGRMSEPCRLYLITPPTLDDPAAFARQFEAACEGGDVAALQVRLKNVPEAAIAAAVAAVAPIARARNVVLILNDWPDLAARLGCDGVHIGQSDGRYADARRAMGKDRIVGVTCHDSRHLAMEAADAGADYVAFGAFFPTTTKDAPTRADPEILSIWQETMLIPCVAIGGVTVDNCRPLVTAGADFLAVSAGVWGYPEGPAAAVRVFNAAIVSGMAGRG
jgi:thiamine-phosphate pyrophosphorylase